jgi:3-hydroxyacyl-[acyl-carrier-protein] dehydratase
MNNMSNNGGVKLPIDIEGITALLPHRYPFLLIDRVIAFEPKKLVAIKNVSGNEEFFQGHFPGHPVMPGVLIIESMAQACGMLVKLSAPPERQHTGVFYLVKVDDARFNRVVVPGDQLRLEVEQKRSMRNMSLFKCQAKVDGEAAAEAELLCAEVAP